MRSESMGSLYSAALDGKMEREGLGCRRERVGRMEERKNGRVVGSVSGDI